jgi:hypothetical protein
VQDCCPENADRPDDRRDDSKKRPGSAVSGRRSLLEPIRHMPNYEFHDKVFSEAFSLLVEYFPHYLKTAKNPAQGGGIPIGWTGGKNSSFTYIVLKNFNYPVTLVVAGCSYTGMAGAARLAELDEDTTVVYSEETVIPNIISVEWGPYVQKCMSPWWFGMKYQPQRTHDEIVSAFLAANIFILSLGFVQLSMTDTLSKSISNDDYIMIEAELHNPHAAWTAAKEDPALLLYYWNLVMLTSPMPGRFEPSKFCPWLVDKVAGFSLFSILLGQIQSHTESGTPKPKPNVGRLTYCGEVDCILNNNPYNPIRDEVLRSQIEAIVDDITKLDDLNSPVHVTRNGLRKAALAMGNSDVWTESWDQVNKRFTRYVHLPTAIKTWMTLDSHPIFACPHIGPCNLDEAISFIKDPSRSAGWPLSSGFHYVDGQKEYIIRAATTEEVVRKYRRILDEQYEHMMEGYQIDVNLCFCKRELRKKAKVDAPRSVIPSSQFARILSLTQVGAYAEAKIEAGRRLMSWNKLGLSSCGEGFDKWAKLYKYKKFIRCADYKGWDATVTPWTLFAHMLYIFRQAKDHSYEYFYRLSQVIEAQAFAYLLVPTAEEEGASPRTFEVYRKMGTMPTGCSLTSPHNTFIHEFDKLYQFYRTGNEDLEKVSVGIYNDDEIEGFNPEDVTQEYSNDLLCEQIIGTELLQALSADKTERYNHYEGVVEFPLLKGPNFLQWYFKTLRISIDGNIDHFLWPAARNRYHFKREYLEREIEVPVYNIYKAMSSIQYTERSFTAVELQLFYRSMLMLVFWHDQFRDLWEIIEQTHGDIFDASVDAGTLTDEYFALAAKAESPYELFKTYIGYALEDN